MLNREVEGFLHEVLSREDKTELAYLINGYALCARSEGKSPKYISLVTTSVRFFTRYLKENGLSDRRHRDWAQQIRGFVLHLQSVNRFAVHPFTKAQASGLSGHTVNSLHAVSKGLLALA